MTTTRRQFLTAATATATATVFAVPATAAAAPNGLDAAQFGVRPGAPDDQSRALQRAIDQAARNRTPLWLAPGVYRAGDLTLPDGAQVNGVRGATRLVYMRGPSLLSSRGANNIALTGLVLEGGGRTLPENRGLVHLNASAALRITDCEVLASGGNGISLEQCDGAITQTTITAAADNALFSIDSRGLRIAGNIISKSGNAGIRVWQSQRRRDGSLIIDNRIDDTAARSGGSGQNGNAINVFRAANVIVRGNQINRAAFTAIRGAAASHIQIIGNSCAELEEVAIYSEFEFENAVIADNLIVGAATGISVTNFKEGGRLATVRGNIVRDLRARIPGTPAETQGVGISAEADTAVTGNVVENAQTAGIGVGWGEYLRDVTVTGNIVRNSGVGVAVSVVKGAGASAISGNQFAGMRRGAIVGMEWHKVVTGDLALSGADRYPQLRISGNQIT